MKKLILLIIFIIGVFLYTKFKVTKYGEVYYITDKASYLIIEGQTFKELK